MEIDDDAIETEAQPLGHRLDDSPVRLMRDQPREIGDRHIVALEDFLGHFGHADDGGLVHSRPILHDVALYAFYLEHQRCGELDGGVDEERVWMNCTGCGAVVSRSLAPIQTDKE